MALVMTEVGHTAIASAVKKQDFYLSLGGLPEDFEHPWTVEEEPPAFDPKATDLILSFGYRKAARVLYAYEDPNGIIVAAGKRWSVTEEPTRHVYIEFRLDAEDAVGKTIYQTGLFMNLRPKADVPEGKLFLLPEEVEDKGILLMGENIRPFHRYEGVREIFEFVLTF